MIRAVIVEDEPLAGRFLESLLLQTGKVEVVGMARDSDWGFTLCADHAPDAVFLDVRMPGRDGVDLATELNKLPKPPLVVFTTGHGDRACDAFRLEAVDYLLKPLEADQVWDAVCRIERKLVAGSTREEAPFQAQEHRLPVKCLRDDVVKLIPKLEIVVAVHRDRRTWIHTAADEYSTYYTIAELQSWLGTASFLRISRESIVNVQAIAEVVHYGDRLYQVRLRDRVGTCLDASRSGSVGLASLLKPRMGR